MTIYMNGRTQTAVLQQLLHGLGIGRKSAVVTDGNFQSGVG